MSPLLEVDDLRVQFATEDGVVRAVDGVSFSVEEGRTLGIVGESGSGKSVTGLTVMGLTRARNATLSGEVRFDGDNVLAMGDQRLRSLRGNDVAMIFQDPLSSMHPYYTVGKQLVEAYRTHHRASKQQSRERATEMLDLVGIPDPRGRLDNYPHEFSGGMRQRAMIAMALMNEPRLLIADEELVPIAGRPPSLITPPSGCRFHPRCPYVRPAHREVEPKLERTSQSGHEVACLLAEPTRQRLWAQLRQGVQPDDARAAVLENEVPS